MRSVKSQKAGRLFFIVFLSLMLFGPAAFTMYVLFDMSKFHRTARSLEGATEAEVVRVLGQPKYVLPKGALQKLPGEVELSFNPKPTRAISGKLLIYVERERAAYVYIDPGGRVEAVEAAGA